MKVFAWTAMDCFTMYIKVNDMIIQALFWKRGYKMLCTCTKDLFKVGRDNATLIKYYDGCVRDNVGIDRNNCNAALVSGERIEH